MDSNPLDKFQFLLGDWMLEYNIPKSLMSEPMKDSGFGTFKKILDGKYVQFDYSTKSGGAAKGIFAWNEKINAFTYYWFENSGNFLPATCNFIDDKTLAMNWHDTLLIQSFKQEERDRVVLKMQYPSPHGGYDLVLEVILHRQ